MYIEWVEEEVNKSMFDIKGLDKEKEQCLFVV